MEPSSPQPSQHLSSTLPNAALSDLLNFQYPSSCVTPLLEDQVSPEMDTLNLPPSRSEDPFTSPPFQPQHSSSQFSSQFSSHPPNASNPPPQPLTFLSPHTPQIYHPTSALPTTPFASPLSISTTPRSSVHPTTPQTTPTLPDPLTSAPPPIPHRVSLIIAAIGHFARYSVECHYTVAINAAKAVAEQKKVQKRNELKSSPRTTAPNKREAGLSRFRDKEYCKAVENELKLWIHYTFEFSRYIEETHLPSD